jgi:hypothetical protein
MSFIMPDQGVRSQSPPRDVNNDGDESVRSQRSKFRFKSSKRKSHHDEDYADSSRHGDHRRRHHHWHSKRRKRSEPPDNPDLYDDTYLPNTSSENYMDPDTAFRESLFDAMADDEGAQFWEGVYGQPIPKIPPVKTTPTGELEAMTEDEYAAHVRAEMYKKTHQYLFEEKERREQAKNERDRLNKQARREQEEVESFRQRVDESLRRGKDRKAKIQRSFEWARKWKEYEMSWEALVERTKSGSTNIPWPVWQGRTEDISKEAIEEFLLNGPTSGKPNEADLFRTLKAERVRWHPDKVQQKLGGQSFSETKMQAVTAVFQIIDRMWTEARDKKN